jgi:hypothetical protein
MIVGAFRGASGGVTSLRCENVSEQWQESFPIRSKLKMFSANFGKFAEI